MIIFDHWTVEATLLPAVCLVLALWIWRVVRARNKLVRWPSRAGAFLLLLASSCALLVNGCAELWNVQTHAEPIYSPDRKHVLVIRDWDAGALGGGTTVDLYSYDGLLEQSIVGGEWKVVERQNARWTSNTEVLLGYEKIYERVPACSSTKAVHVVCVPSK